jgi:glycosyltransferase involved in cell wall biosynthesis
MPSYNYEKYLPEAINSVLNQTIPDLELIIVDDGSKDNSRNIIESYQVKDARIKPIFHVENLGISRTYNDGTKNAKGKYVAFIDSDDIWLDTKLEKQLAVLKKNDELVVWSEGEIIDQNGAPTGTTFTQFENGVKRKKSGYIFEELFFDDNFVFDSSIILKKENLPQRGFDESLKYLNDYRFIVDLARKHEFCFLEEPLAKYRIHGKNTIFNNERAWHRDRVAIYKAFLSDYNTVISKKSKAHLLFKMGCAYAELGERELARRNIFAAIRANPFGRKATVYLMVGLTGMRLMV